MSHDGGPTEGCAEGENSIILSLPLLLEGVEGGVFIQRSQSEETAALKVPRPPTLWKKGVCGTRKALAEGYTQEKQIKDGLAYLSSKGITVDEEELVGTLVSCSKGLEEVLHKTQSTTLETIKELRKMSSIVLEVEGCKRKLFTGKVTLKKRNSDRFQAMSNAVRAGVRLGRSGRQRSLFEAVNDDQIKGWLGVSSEPTTPMTPKCQSSTRGFTESLGKLAERRADHDNPVADKECVIRALADYPFVDIEMLDSIDSWEFDQSFLKDTPQPMLEIGLCVFHSYTLVSKLKLTASLPPLLRSIADGYQNVPYHNQHHACDVLQTVHYLISSTSLGQYLTDIQILALLISAAGHDYAHPGLDNKAVSEMQPELGQLFGEGSLLEKSHIAGVLAIIDTCLTSLETSILKQLKSTVNSLILATDITCQSFVKNFQNNPTIEGLMCVVLHAADVSNPAKPTSVYLEWTSKIITEFWCQGELQKALGMLVSPMCDKDSMHLPRCQLGFIGVVVKPLYYTLGKWLDIKEPLSLLSGNSDLWMEPDQPPIVQGMDREILDQMERWVTGVDLIVEYAARRKFLMNKLVSVLKGYDEEEKLKEDKVQKKPGNDSYKYPGVEQGRPPMFGVVKLCKEQLPMMDYPVLGLSARFKEEDDNARRRRAGAFKAYRLAPINKPVYRKPHRTAFQTDTERTINDAIASAIDIIDDKVAPFVQIHDTFSKALNNSLSVANAQSRALVAAWTTVRSKWSLTRKQERKLNLVWEKWLEDKSSAKLPPLHGLSPQAIVLQRY